MNDEKSQTPEPTMEEILASIRRIISEDDQGPGKTALEATADNDILDLTERVDGPQRQAQSDPRPIDQGGSELASIPARPDDTEPSPRTPEGESGLVSAVTAAAATKALREFVAALEQGSGHVGDITFASGDTLEELVKDAVKPMAKEWLDRNLPTLVEDLVRKEIRRLAGRAEDI